MRVHAASRSRQHLLGVSCITKPSQNNVKIMGAFKNMYFIPTYLAIKMCIIESVFIFEPTYVIKKYVRMSS